MFLILIFDLEYFIRVQSSEPLHAKMNPTSCNGGDGVRGGWRGRGRRF
jgi:hypothetical protein